MKLRIEKYTADRLREYITSPAYLESATVPVSVHRAQSWIHNPRLESSDILLYTAFEGEEMLAYRCILPDRSGDLRFGWLSGNWVLPSRRRQGLASRLFEEAFKDWGGRLMYTNYAPESKAVYDKSGQFDLYHERAGYRYYLRSASSGLLGRRNIFFRLAGPVLKTSDGIVNSWQDTRIRASMRKILPDFLHAEPVRIMDPDIHTFLAQHDRLGFGRRGLQDFHWIEAHPWIKEGEQRDKKYFFSSIAPKFRNVYLKLLDAGGALAGFVMIVIVGDKMSLPYFAVEETVSKLAVNMLDHYLAVNKISYFTTYNPELTELMNESTLPILGKRKMMQKYFATHELAGQLPDARGIIFQDGDGDVVFT